MDKFKLRVNPIRELMLIIGFIFMLITLFNNGYADTGLLIAAMIFGGLLEVIHLIRHRKFFKMVKVPSKEIEFSILLIIVAIIITGLNTVIRLNSYYLSDLIAFAEIYLIGLFIVHSFFSKNKLNRLIVSFILMIILVFFQHYSFASYHPTLSAVSSNILMLLKFSIIIGIIKSYIIFEPKLDTYKLKRDDYIIGCIYGGYGLLLTSNSIYTYDSGLVEILISIGVNVFSTVVIMTLLVNEFMNKWINHYSILPFHNITLQISVVSLTLALILSVLNFDLASFIVNIINILLIVVYIKVTGVKCLNIKKLYSQK